MQINVNDKLYYINDLDDVAVFLEEEYRDNDLNHASEKATKKTLEDRTKKEDAITEQDEVIEELSADIYNLQTTIHHLERTLNDILIEEFYLKKRIHKEKILKKLESLRDYMQFLSK